MTEPDGSRFQLFETVHESVLDNSVSVLVNERQWTEVEFFNENDNGFYYTIDYDENYKAIIRFADDIRGRIPAFGAQIVIRYRYGGGERGLVDAGYMSQVINVTSSTVPGAIPVTMTNYTNSEGGEGAESIEAIKHKLPLWVKAQDRCVTGGDYAVMSEMFSTSYNGRIGKALAVLRHSGCAGNIIDVYVLQLDANDKLKTARTILKQGLAEHLDSKKMLTDYVCIKDAGQVFQNISVNVAVKRFNAQHQKNVHDIVQERVAEFFALERWSIGQPLMKTDFVRYISNMPEISTVTVEFASNTQNLTGDNDSVAVDFWKIIRPGNVNINVELVD